MKRVSFWDIFREGSGGILRLVKTISVNGIKYIPGEPHNGNQWGGVDFFKLRGKDLAVDIKEEDHWIVKGFF
jgi:hypothetical protein